MDEQKDNIIQKAVIQNAVAVNTSKSSIKTDYNSRRDRKYYDDQAKRDRIRDEEIFQDKKTAIDPYTGNLLHKNKDAAKSKYGKQKTTLHIGQTDHTIPIDRVYKAVQVNPYLSAEQTKNIVNITQNYVFTNAHFNTSKKNLTNIEYIKKTRADLSDLDLIRISITNTEKLSTRHSEGKDISDRQVQIMLKKDFEARVAISAAYLKETSIGIAREATDGAISATRYEAIFSGYRHLNNLLNGEEDYDEAVLGTITELGNAVVQGATTSVMKKGIEQTALQGMYTLDSDFATLISDNFLDNTDFMKYVATAKQIGSTVYRYIQGDMSLEELVEETAREGSGLATMNLLGQGFAIAGRLIGKALGNVCFLGSLIAGEIGGQLGEMTGRFVGEFVGYCVGTEWYKMISKTFHEDKYAELEYQQTIQKNKDIRAQLEKTEIDLIHQMHNLGMRRELINTCLSAILSDQDDKEYIEALRTISVLCCQDINNRKTKDQIYTMMIDDDIPFEL